MIIENNGWSLTDNDCLQYCKKHSDTEFSFIQAVWLDTCGDDKRAENAVNEYDNYAVCASYIDLELYSDKDKEIAVFAYGYNLDTVKEIYEDDANQIIAECLFETDCLYDSHSIAGVVSYNDAASIIYKYMKEN